MYLLIIDMDGNFYKMCCL